MKLKNYSKENFQNMQKKRYMNQQFIILTSILTGITSLANISKIYLRDIMDFTHSKFCIGVSDDGDITGIPLKEINSNLKEELVKKCR